MLLTILVTQEYVLSFLPNIQLTMLLYIIYTKNLSKMQMFCMTICHVLIDNMLYGGIGLYSIPMMISWLWVVFMLKIIKIEHSANLALYSAFLSMIYSIPFATTHLVVYGNIIGYMIMDIPFIILMATSSFISVLWLYEPLNKIVKERL